MAKLVTSLRDNGGVLEGWDPVNDVWVVLTNQSQVLSGYTPSGDAISIPIIFDTVLEEFQVWSPSAQSYLSLQDVVSPVVYDYEMIWSGVAGTQYNGTNMDRHPSSPEPFTTLGFMNAKNNGSGLLEWDDNVAGSSFSGYSFTTTQQDVELETTVSWDTDDGSWVGLFIRGVSTTDFHAVIARYDTTAGHDLRVVKREGGGQLDTFITVDLDASGIALNTEYRLELVLATNNLTGRIHMPNGTYSGAADIGTLNDTNREGGVLWANKKNGLIGPLKGNNS